jgi:hypothetical protein
MYVVERILLNQVWRKKILDVFDADNLLMLFRMGDL